MPRELFPEPPGGSEPVLTASPETRSPAQLPHLDLEDMAQDLGGATMFWDEGSGEGGGLAVTSPKGAEDDDEPWTQSGLHPHVQVLCIADLEACVALENAAFPENERCSREKVCERGWIGPRPNPLLVIYFILRMLPIPNVLTDFQSSGLGA